MPADVDQRTDDHDGGFPDGLQLDPTELALEGSRWREDRLPDALCAELGRTLLMAELEFSEWVLRRVEKVTFERDRSVSRAVTIEINIRRDAPVFIDRDGRSHWLIPLSMMRRRNLVNLDIRDDLGEPVTMPGIRLTQQLDESILLAAAAATISTSGTEAEFGSEETNVRLFIQRFIAGEVDDVASTIASFERPEPVTPVSPGLYGGVKDAETEPGALPVASVDVVSDVLADRRGVGS